MADDRGPETLTITLTGRAPVKIRKAEWPIVATAYDQDNPGNDPTRTSRLTIRQHADGRAIVYAVFATAFEHEEDRRRGALLAPGDDLGAAAHAVASDMVPDDRHADERAAEYAAWHDLAELVLADLPAETI